MVEYHIPTLSKTNRWIIIISVCLFLLSSFVPLGPILSLNLEELKRGAFYQLLFFPLIEDSFVSQLFNSLLLWFIGSDIEAKLGTKNYRFFLLSSLLVSALLFLLLSFWKYPGATLQGTSGICFSLLMAYGTIYGDRILTFMMIFPMKARYFCLLLMGVELYMGIFSHHSMQAWGNIFALLGGAFFLKWKYQLHFGLNFPRQISFFQKFSQKKRPNLYIVDDDPKKPRYWQ